MKLAGVNQCTGCWACASACPKQCIHMEPDAEGFLRPIVDEDICIACGSCQRACPILSPMKVPDSIKTQAYGAYIEDLSVREQSTSGGVFTALCNWVLARGGVIFGAVYDDDFTVKHCRVDNEKELWRLRGAKYAQSNLDDIFLQVKTLLLQGREVLFSGTPCQIAGLQAYLGKTWEQLLLVDVVCHGVPSPSVWKHYVQYRSNIDANGSKPTVINLRSKETGWPGYSIQFDYENSSKYIVKNFDDPYLRAFVGDLCLRPSCYACKFKGILRASDFTLADYWGVERQIPELHDEKGTSLVLVHSNKGRRIWNELAPQIKYREVSPENAVLENPSVVKASTRPQNREVFMERYVYEDFTKLTDELLPTLKKAPPSVIKRIYRKLKRIFT